MSEFSDLLSLLIKSRNVNVSGLTGYCDLDRSTMYKIMNGKRNPSSPEQVRRISEFMNLNPLENRELMNAYQMTRIGWDVFYRRKNVLEFLLNFQNIHAKSSFYVPFSDYDSEAVLRSGDSAVPLSSRIQVSSAIHNLCLQALSASGGSLDIISQPEHLESLDIAASLISGRSDLDIRHIICINNSRSLIRAQQDYNLQCLTKMIPFFGIGCQYSPYYYYDDVNSHFNNLNFMPCIFLTRDSAVVCSSDLKEGILFQTASLVSLLQGRFDTLLKIAQPLILSFHSSLEFHLREFPTALSSAKDTYSLSAEPCLVPCLTEVFLKKYLRRDIPAISDFVGSVENYVKFLSNVSFHNYFTRDGVRMFLKTGRMHEVPEEYYSPLEYADRIRLLRQLRSQLTDGREIRLLNTPLDRFPLNLHLFSAMDLGYILFSGSEKQLSYLLLKEQNLLNAFYDFAASLEESDLLCSAGDTDAFLKELVE
mgnify:CR=1 FL=1